MAANTHTFEVRAEEPGGQVTTKRVEASCFQGEDDLIVFKDAQGHAVYAVHHDTLLSVERVAVTHETRPLINLHVSAAPEEGTNRHLRHPSNAPLY